VRKVVIYKKKRTYGGLCVRPNGNTGEKKSTQHLKEGTFLQMVGWSQSTGCFGSPHFVDPETKSTLILPEEKRSLLVRSILQKAACGEDIPMQLGHSGILTSHFLQQHLKKYGTFY
jgi:hypothetical protein